MSDEVRSESGFDEIIGESAALKRTLALAKSAAASDEPVLIVGETGSGKETIARAIHRLSARRDGGFIKVNCAATANELFDGMLFGEGPRDDGSGEIGRLEMANRGTLFLDEITRFPLDLQPKLVRLLTSGEFERFGSTRTNRVDARLIAATKQDPVKWVAENRLLRALYDQFNTFPIQIRPLRERREDIPLLVRYFVQKFARRMNKHIETIPPETMAALQNHDWPSNVRQLENFIERSVILTNDSRLQTPLNEL